MKQSISIKQAGIIGNCLTLELAPSELDKAKTVLDEGMERNKPLACVLGVVEKRRSKNANAYFWELCNQLAAKVDRNPIEIYRDCIKDIDGEYSRGCLQGIHDGMAGTRARLAGRYHRYNANAERFILHAYVLVRFKRLQFKADGTAD